MNSRRGHSVAFTLIELLVVIAVIAILTALTLPALNAVRDTARLAVCRNNLRQVGTALYMYSSETGFYPSGHSGGHWIIQLLPYLKLEHLASQIVSGGYLSSNSFFPLSNTVFSCPGFNRMPGTYNQDGSTPFGMNLSGTIHPQISRMGLSDVVGPAGNQVIRPVGESEVVNPSRMIALGDSTILAPTGLNNNIDPPFVVGSAFLRPFHTGASVADKYFQKRHRSRRWNLAFADAHVETTRIELVFDSSNPAIRVLWNRDHQPH